MQCHQRQGGHSDGHVDRHRDPVELIEAGCGVRIPLGAKRKIPDLRYLGGYAELRVEAGKRHDQREPDTESAPLHRGGEAGQSETRRRPIEMEGGENWTDHGPGKLGGREDPKRRGRQDQPEQEPRADLPPECQPEQAAQ